MIHMIYTYKEFNEKLGIKEGDSEMGQIETNRFLKCSLTLYIS